MPILNYTTTISVDKTVGEVTKVLARKGVARISTLYDTEGAPSGLAFTMTTPHGPREFEIPVNVEGVLASMKRDRNVPNSKTNPAQAQRVAWRILKDWIEAQVALIEAQMASLDQIMLPYLIVNPGQTLYAVYQAREMAAIEA